jgi:mRNA-degrading endonuclease RelE of RelBE toxin-antitoxin system
MYSVLVPKRVAKAIEKIPEPIRRKLVALVEQLQESGPIQPKWPNYGRLSPNRYHCHLSDSWVACWYHEIETAEIEVYYVGSRQNAPY